MRLKTQIKSRQPAVSCVVAQVETRLNAIEINTEKVSEICLVLAEALNNVVEHAYRYAEDGEIDVELTLSNHWITISIIDSGPAFTVPNSKERVAPTSEDLELLSEGGFGWNLIRMLTDEISLKRTKNKNQLMLKIKTQSVAI